MSEKFMEFQSVVLKEVVEQTLKEFRTEIRKMGMLTDTGILQKMGLITDTDIFLVSEDALYKISDNILEKHNLKGDK